MAIGLLGNSQIESVKNQLVIIPMANGVSDNTFILEVKNCAQVTLFSAIYFCDITQPHQPHAP
jgi:hypothetical protein